MKVTSTYLEKAVTINIGKFESLKIGWGMTIEDKEGGLHSSDYLDLREEVDRNLQAVIDESLQGLKIDHVNVEVSKPKRVKRG